MKKQFAIVLACVALAHSGLCLTANEIIANVQKKYAGLTSLSASGKVISDFDASGVDLASVLPADAKPPTDAQLQAAKAAAQQRRTMTMDFTVRVARPELYHVAWSQQIAPGQLNKGAAWSAGNGFFLLLGDKKVMQQIDLNLGLASATGVSSGVANTLPSMFFQRPSSLLALLRNIAQFPDETISGEDCYVVTGEAAGQKITLWITRAFLVKQKRHTLGGTVTLPAFRDEDVKSGLEQAGQKATSESAEQFKKLAQLMQNVSSQMKGSITETYENIQVNQPLSRESFAQALPPTVER